MPNCSGISLTFGQVMVHYGFTVFGLVLCIVEELEEADHMAKRVILVLAAVCLSQGAAVVSGFDGVGLYAAAIYSVHFACPGDIDGNAQMDLDDLQAIVDILLTAGSPFVVPCGGGGCPDMDDNGQVDLDDLQALVEILLEGGSPFIVECSQPQQPIAIQMIPIPGAGFSIGKYPVTNAQYCEYLNSAYSAGLIKLVQGAVYAANDIDESYLYTSTSEGYTYSRFDFGDGVFSLRTKDGHDMSNHPMAQVRFEGAAAFCDYYGYRLPTEEEWEYAARGGFGGVKYPWGDTWDNDRGNCRESGDPYESGDKPWTTPVDFYPAQNAYGLNDVAGNVWEWTSSCYYEDCRYDRHVLRGGGWMSYPNYCTLTSRFDPGSSNDHFGFRPLLDSN